jgi:hypothetical protein
MLLAGLGVVIAAAAVAGSAARPPVVLEVMKAQSHGGDAPFTSYWSPAIVHTRSNKTLVFAQADTLAARARKGPFGERMVTSTDLGQSFGQPLTIAHWYEAAPQFLYSRESDTILMLRSTHSTSSTSTTTADTAVSDDGGTGTPPMGPGLDPTQPVWAKDLPKLPAKAIASCNTAISRSTDGTRD